MRKLRQSRRSNSKNLPNLPRECPKVTLKKLGPTFFTASKNTKTSKEHFLRPFQVLRKNNRTNFYKAMERAWY